MPGLRSFRTTWVSEWSLPTPKQDAVDMQVGRATEAVTKPAEALHYKPQTFARLDLSFDLTLVFPCPRSPISGRRIYTVCYYILDIFNLFLII